MVENSSDVIVYKWNHAQPLGEIAEGSQGSFAEVVVRATRYDDDWTNDVDLTGGTFKVGGTFVGGNFDQYRFMTCEGITYLIDPSYRFMTKQPVTNGHHTLFSRQYSLSHPF